MVMEATGRCLPKAQSPLASRETFALFDEPRCRGVDLKLGSKATAVLTLGPDMCKDKFMQAAGRMRQLDCNQSLIILGETKTFDEIKRINRMKKRELVTAKHVLSWIMVNTVKSICKGIGIWSDQGIFFATEAKPEHAILDEKMDLEAFYGGPLHKISIANIALESKEFHTTRTGVYSSVLIDQIEERSQYLGRSYFVSRSCADEECERELEREIEKEEEEEEECPQMIERNEVNWDQSTVFQSNSAPELPTTILSFANALKQFVSNKSLSCINWSKSIYCTQNFFKTIDSTGYLDEFLRIPDCFIQLPQGDILLLSEREAENMLVFFFEKKRKNIPVDGYYFGHYVFEAGINSKSLLHYQPNGYTCKITSHEACSLKLFNGETMYPSDQYNCLKEMLSYANKSLTSDIFKATMVCGEPETLIVMRRKYKDYERSDLQTICSEIVSEFEI
mmetsp:Transcript_40978/g.96212  ORF Transcript_40978/g.96212 Transcript_40978/m.96212 type:complete len:450 (-) Transcript_40978:67-1416(-)